MTGDSRDAAEAITATVTASRALVGIVARSMATALDDLSLPQLRVLMVLDGEGPMRMGALAEATGVHPSTLSRMADRLKSGGWIRRDVSPDSRREVIVHLSETGRDLVTQVTLRRRRAIAAVLRTLDQDDRAVVRRGMELFAAAAQPSSRDLLVLGVVAPPTPGAD